MLSLADTILLSIALAMDCFAVSIVSGILLRRIVWRVLIQMSVLFGIFQALMPLLGWTVAGSFAHHVNTWGHWIAFALLLLIGLNMIRESRLPEEEHHFNPTRLTTQLMLSVATSIDAMAVGVSMALTGFETLHQLVLPLVIIGVGSLLFAVAGQLLGIRFGERFNRRLKTEAIGGIILIIIGIKIVASHYISL